MKLVGLVQPSFATKICDELPKSSIVCNADDGDDQMSGRTTSELESQIT
jgi:hypothetical protein